MQPLTWSHNKLQAFLGMSLARFQLLLFGVSLGVSGLFWFLQGSPNFPSTFLYTYVVGNVTVLLLSVSAPLFDSRTGLSGWAIYLAILLPIAAAGSSMAALLLLAIYGYHGAHLWAWLLSNIQLGTLISLMTGIAIYAVNSTRSRLEARNSLLQNEVQQGLVKLKAQEAELQTAHDIQAHLLPAEVPQIAGFQIACAWQPAQSVGGDYFDVLAYSDSQIAICLADVSGKGISAALLMANLQAAFRGFATAEIGPGELCGRLNEVLCSNIAPGKFVTFFYGMLERDTSAFRFENAGHSPPILLRGGEWQALEGGGTVLGIFPHAEYEDRLFQLQAGDCLLLTTDGVTEAADAQEEEFGSERLVASALSARSAGVNAMRTRILEDVTRFCNGSFQDDASLIVITVDG